MTGLTLGDRRFAERAVRRGRLFLVLSIASVVMGLGLAAHAVMRRLADPDYPVGTRAVIIVLLLLNGRQNLRQYRCAKVIEGLMQNGRVDDAR